MDMRRCIAIITNLDIAIKPSILPKDVISLLILKLHRICAFWKKLNYFSECPYVLGSKKNTLFSIAGNFMSDKYQIFEKLYQTVDLSRIRRLDFNECLYSAIYKMMHLRWTRSLDLQPRPRKGPLLRYTALLLYTQLCRKSTFLGRGRFTNRECCMVNLRSWSLNEGQLN